MANPYFQFKKFIVHQEHTSMKVCTDACLFGAWVTQEKEVKNIKSILDIGAGTGLLSLMLAQSTEATNTFITAIEIEENAYKQANSNFQLSPWSKKIKCIHESIQLYNEASIKMDSVKYDCIITNPPFYEGDLKSPDAGKNKASHCVSLTWDALVKCVGQLLETNGTYYVMTPSLRSYTMQKLAQQNGLQLATEVLVYNDAKHLPIRAFQKFIKTASPIQTIERSKIIIKDIENKYSETFNELLKDYYLYL